MTSLSQMIVAVRGRLSESRSKFLTKECPGCSKFRHPNDFIVNYCVYCSEERIRNAIEKFRPMDNTKEFFPRCAECHKEIILHGYKLWDSLARSYKLVCTSCGEKQFAKDPQYKESIWGYANKY